MLHYAMLHCLWRYYFDNTPNDAPLFNIPLFNVRLFDNELAAVAIVLFTLIITAQFNIAVFQYDTI